ncbi:hypothetical protein ACHAQA_006281 [Verticillium albo-atrum]
MRTETPNVNDLERNQPPTADGQKPFTENSSSDDEPSVASPAGVVPAVDEMRDDSDAESIGGQRNTMTTKRLLIAVPALSVCLFVSFVDQTSVSTATPAIAGDLDTGTATSWIGASFLIASTAFQLINGRLSDIFGRKNLLLICLALMGLGDLACIGGGGINSLVMIIVSDITTLQNRGKYQGILGAIIALANGVGPFLGGAVVESSTWRWVFWMIPIMVVPSSIVILFYLPLKHRSGNYVEKMKKIDYGGIFLNVASTLLLLVPLSGGGVTYPWASPFLISTITIGGVLAVLFVLYEWKLAALPIMPLRLYKAPHCSYLYMQSFLIGLAYFGNFFYLPIYFQSVLKYSPLVSGALILPIVITTSFSSILSGQLMSWSGRYMPCVLAGFVLWTLGGGLKLLFDRDTGLSSLIPILVVEGAGIGLTLQPTLVGMYANSRSEDRAVTTGLRNFIRTIGGAFGLVVSGAILSNTLSRDLTRGGYMDGGEVGRLTSSMYELQAMGLSEDKMERILEVYMDGLHYIFIFYMVCAALALVLTVGVGNTDLKSKSPSSVSTSEDEESVPEVGEASDLSNAERGEAETKIVSERTRPPTSGTTSR